MRQVTKLKKDSEKGFALVESIAFLFVFIVLTAYTVDFFSIIHTGILGSMASRTYLFETLQHRSDIRMLRQENPENEMSVNFEKSRQRFHGINDEEQVDDDATHAVGRTLTQVDEPIAPRVELQGGEQLDSKKLRASSIVIKSGYGICLDAICK